MKSIIPDGTFLPLPKLAKRLQPVVYFFLPRWIGTLVL
jgi:hypothetical protein